jgi:hypothetical protein
MSVIFILFIHFFKENYFLYIQLCHVSTTTGIQYNDFIKKWKEIKKV